MNWNTEQYKCSTNTIEYIFVKKSVFCVFSRSLSCMVVGETDVGSGTTTVWENAELVFGLRRRPTAGGE